MDELLRILSFLIMLAFLWAHWASRQKVWKTQSRRRSELDSRPSAVTNALVIDSSRDWIDDETPGPRYLVLRFTPDIAGASKTTARYYPNPDRTDIVMLVGRTVRVRHALDDPEVVVLEDDF